MLLSLGLQPVQSLAEFCSKHKCLLDGGNRAGPPGADGQVEAPKQAQRKQLTEVDTAVRRAVEQPVLAAVSEVVMTALAAPPPEDIRERIERMRARTMEARQRMDD